MVGNTSGKRPILKYILIFGGIFVAGVVFAGLFNMGLHHTNQLEFCTSCHTMTIPYEEYKKTLHYKNKSGVRAICSDCHVPKDFGPKMVAKVMASKDVYHEILGTIDTPEKYEALRWKMANVVWAKMKASNSRECRSCHDLTQMDVSAQTRSGRSQHSQAEDKGKTCIDCHKGVAHTEPEDPGTTSESADLAVTKTDGTTTYTPGDTAVYTLVVTNAGPSNVTGASVADALPTGITTAAWTCAASAGSSCAATGTGAISDTVNILSGGTATYTLTLTIPAGRTGDLVNTATVSAPTGTTDPIPGNNSATDTDTDTNAPRADKEGGGKEGQSEGVNTGNAKG